MTLTCRIDNRRSYSAAAVGLYGRRRIDAGSLRHGRAAGSAAIGPAARAMSTRLAFGWKSARKWFELFTTTMRICSVWIATMRSSSRSSSCFLPLTTATRTRARQPLGGARDAALAHQHLEGDEEVEVQVGEIDLVAALSSATSTRLSAIAIGVCVACPPRPVLPSAPWPSPRAARDDRGADASLSVTSANRAAPRPRPGRASRTFRRTSRGSPTASVARLHLCLEAA